MHQIAAILFKKKKKYILKIINYRAHTKYYLNNDYAF